MLDSHLVRRGEHIGYRQRPMPRDGTLLIIAGGTSHGIGLEAPKAVAGRRARGKSLAKGGLEAAGFSLSPFTIDGKQRWFAEPPHMQASMIFLPASAAAPEVGDSVDVAVRFTTATFDAVNLLLALATASDGTGAAGGVAASSARARRRLDDRRLRRRTAPARAPARAAASSAREPGSSRASACGLGFFGRLGLRGDVGRALLGLDVRRRRERYRTRTGRAPCS